MNMLQPEKAIKWCNKERQSIMELSLKMNTKLHNTCL